MKGMKSAHITILGLVFAAIAQGQSIQFSSSPELAGSYYAKQTPRFIGHCVDSLGSDTVYIENINSGVMERTIYNYPLSRYEYYADNTHFRRIEIVQRTDRVDTLMTEDLETGELEIIVRPDLVDIPKGAYLEFFPNGNIRILGTLDGYSPDGKLKKTGEWKEWDADGKVIRQETYP